VLASPAAAAPPPAPDVPARSYLVVDAEDGDVLAARAPTRQSSIASTTKLMTALVARRSLKLGETVVAPPYQALAAESLLGLDTGERIEVRDLLYGLLLASGNDAAVALAQASAGSTARFVGRMNAAARRLGLDDTSYANPIGLDEAGNYSTARDLVDLTLELREDRTFRRIFDTPAYDTTSGARPRHVVNRNTLVTDVPWIDGVKTGYTLDAGYVLVGSGEQGRVELVSAVLGAPSEAARDDATLALLTYGLSLYRKERAVKRGEVVATAAVRDQGEELELVAEREVELTVRRDERVDVEVDAPDEVVGPVRRGERLGELLVSIDGELEARVALAAANAIDEASLVERFDAAVPGPRAGAFAVAIVVVAVVLVGAVALVGRRHRGA
jgi:D-alanyl-D-alanine carboxypeptidase (penicillin-binding protein 5/6)